MTSAANTSVRGNVRTTDELDGLIVTADSAHQARDLRRLLKLHHPDLKIASSADGYAVQIHDADQLLDSPVDLRWTAEARRFAENRRRAKRQHPSLYRSVARLRVGGRREAEALLGASADVRSLDDHQVVNVASMTLPDAFGLCLFDEQGAGKTVSLIHAFDLLVARDEVDFALIVAPKSMIAEWKSDFQRFKGDLYTVSIATGDRTHKRAVLRSGADVIVTNFETVVTLEEELTSLLRSRSRRALLVVDESFFIKSPAAKRTRAIKRVREWAGRAYVLCGTPAPNAPSDIIEQMNVVDFGLTFAQHGIRGADAVRDALASKGVYLRHLKQDVLPELLAKRFTRVSIEMPAEQSRLYRATAERLIADLRNVSDEEFLRQMGNFLARRSLLLQICSNPAAVMPTYTEIPAKIAALDPLLERMIGAEREKVIIWSFYRKAIEFLMSRYARFCPVRYDGSVDDVAVRRAAVKRFQDDESTMLFIGNPAAAGAGLTLHRARYAVYESMSNQAAHYLQSLDRIHRRGQSRQAEYIVLLCENTIEVPEYERLLAKERVAQDLLGDTTDASYSRQIMLSELLHDYRSQE